MNFIEIPKTNREDWLQWRHNGIGSSDVPVIMGVSRYKTIDELLIEKSQKVAIEDTSNGYIKDRGNRIEMTVRKFYEEQMGLSFSPMSCQSLEHSFMCSTLDGIDEGKNLIIEIKLLSSQNPDKLNINSPGYIKWANAKDKEIVPEEYYPQIQHQLAVTRVPTCVFLGYKELRGKKTIDWDDVCSVSVMPNEKYINDMVIKCIEFWNEVLKRRSYESKS